MAGQLVRCAIYTRRSSDTGLEDQHVNSLAAQRDVCSAYIRCNAHRGWIELPQQYDDGGFSGGNLDRPALRDLLAACARGEVDAVVFYKIDRLTRSLADFVRLTDSMQQTGISFVSVTQAFDTSDSMGRMVLNILLTFAQFEREMLSDRIKDKLRTMRQRGYFVNGHPPLGYDKVEGKLVVNEAEAALVRRIFETFDTYPTAWAQLQQLRADGVRIKEFARSNGQRGGGSLINQGSYYAMLQNRLYLGEMRDGSEWKPAAHAPIVTEELWARVHEVHAARTKRRVTWDPTRNPLRGLIFDHYGRPLQLQSGGVGRQRYRYYASEARRPGRGTLHDKVRVRADVVEELTSAAIINLLEEISSGSLVGAGTSPFEGMPAEAVQRALSRLASGRGSELRSAYEAFLRRAIVEPSELRLTIDPPALRRFVVEDDIASPGAVARGSRVTHEITVTADLICAHRDFRLPIKPSEAGSRPDRKLVLLLQRAARAREEVLRRRGEPIEVIALSFKLGPSKFSRLLRLNYLAPDIQTAIMDGTQPPSLTAHRLIYAPLPLDWGQQRQLLAFPAPPTALTRVHPVST